MKLLIKSNTISLATLDVSDEIKKELMQITPSNFLEFNDNFEYKNMHFDFNCNGFF
jgi:ABC-type Zn2+ transport system substrate-binding protein/surface adhesin